MANIEDEYVLYWNQIWHMQSVRWEPKTKTGRFQSPTGAYKYHIFTAATKVDLHHQESDQNVWYQALHVIPPDEKGAELPIEISNRRKKGNVENLTKLMDMTTDKLPDTQHLVGSDQEILSEEHTET